MTESLVTLPQLEASLRQRVADSRVAVEDGRRTASVYVLFQDPSTGPSVLLIKRANDLGQHRGEWAFPGGVMEDCDTTLLDCARRELEEELGVVAADVDHWGELRPVSTRSGYLVWPFTGRLAEDTPIRPSSREVADVVTVPVSSLADRSSWRTISQLQGGSVRQTDAYAYEGRVIWGATARILSEVLEVISAA